MAMILDAFAYYVQNMLTEMVKEEVHMLLGVRDDIDKMDVKLGDLKNFLADADRRNITDKTVQEWVGQLKRAMYEAADILDVCQLKAMERGSSTVDVGCFNPLLFCMRNPSHAHDIATRIKGLNKRLDTIKERSAAFSFINLGSYEDRSSKVDRAPAIKRVGHEFLQSYHHQNLHPSHVVKGLISLENIASLIELQVIENFHLERITNLPRLQKLTITRCPKLKVLEGVPALQRLMLEDDYMETLPEYMGSINPRRLELYCSLALLASMTVAQSGLEWDKFSHIEHVKAYAHEGDNPRKW
ncbi:hypothetical protein TRIUR3_03241 [Triticum urartu]|uniref:Disease resistance N-terminal domain-containing protein n=1 Tax=Triticum urartu TaxID=4572 RepID=M8AP18_TRIUA|nr:hypothetical protein TRIUR3_03241 [Triticum urartu]